MKADRRKSKHTGVSVVNDATTRITPNHFIQYEINV